MYGLLYPSDVKAVLYINFMLYTVTCDGMEQAALRNSLPHYFVVVLITVFVYLFQFLTIGNIHKHALKLFIILKSMSMQYTVIYKVQLNQKQFLMYMCCLLLCA